MPFAGQQDADRLQFGDVVAEDLNNDEDRHTDHRADDTPHPGRQSQGTQESNDVDIEPSADRDRCDEASLDELQGEVDERRQHRRRKAIVCDQRDRSGEYDADGRPGKWDEVQQRRANPVRR
jgi:hypothetical protein